MIEMSLAQDLAYALDPVAFAEDRLKWRPDPWQRDLLRSTAKQSILLCSRQSGKSTVTAVIATHTAVYSDGALIVLIAPSLRQSRELFAKVADFLKALQPVEPLEEDNKLSCTLANGSRIVALPGDAKTTRGFSAPALIIEDEAAFVSDELHLAIRPMRAVSRGRLILMSTPFGRRGHFFEGWQNGGDTWERIAVPATACPRITPEFLEEERNALGDWHFRQEYLNEFVEGQDNLFSYDLVQSAISDDVAPLFSPAEFAAMGGV
jgi:hypothetical protein